MESYKNPIINKEIEKVTIPGFETIQEMLSAHLSLLMQHYTYLNKIKLGRIPEDDLFDYLKDVLGFGVPDNGKFKNDYLPELLVSLKTQIDVFMKLCEVSKHPNQQIAASTLYLALDLELAYAKHHAKMASFNQVYFKYKMQTIVGGPDCIKSFLKCLKPLLPELHDHMSEIINFNLDVKSEYKKKGNQTYVEFMTSWTYAWNKSFLRIEKFIRDLGGIPSRKKNNQYDVNKETEKLKEWGEKRKQQVMLKEGQQLVGEEEKRITIDSIGSIPNVAARIQARMAENQNYVSHRLEDNYELLLNNVNFHYEIYPSILQIENALLKMKEEQQVVHDLQRSFNDVKNQADVMVRSLHGISGLLIRSIKKSCQGKKYVDHVSSFEALLSEIEKVESNIQVMNDVFPRELMVDWPNGFIDGLLLEYKKTYKNIKLQLKAIESRYFDLVETYKRIDHKKTEIQSVPSILPQAPNPERAAFLREREKIIQEYKSIVQQQRQQKEELKLKNQVKKPDVLERKIVVYKDIEVEACLLGLSDQHFELLLDLFNFKKGIRYSDVCHLIVNQLGGEIEEIGNGSSHKRIRIAKYLIEMTSHEGQAKAQESPSSSSVAVGGFFRPHGGAHQSGVMPRFNMELVVKTFEKAGIRQDVLNQLQEKRLAQRAQAGM